MARKMKMVKTNNTTTPNQLSLNDLRVQLEEAQIRAELSEARAKNTEAVLRIKKARIINEILNKDNISDFLK